MIILKIACYVMVITYTLLIIRHLYKVSQNTTKSEFKVGDRVVLMDMFLDSKINTGNHMPYHGEILAVRKSFNFRFEYDVLPDFSNSGDYKRNVLEHNISHPHDTDKPNVVKFTLSIDDLHKLK